MSNKLQCTRRPLVSAMPSAPEVMNQEQGPTKHYSRHTSVSLASHGPRGSKCYSARVEYTDSISGSSKAAAILILWRCTRGTAVLVPVPKRPTLAVAKESKGVG